MNVFDNVAYGLHDRGLSSEPDPRAGGRGAEPGRARPATSSATAISSPAGSSSAWRWRARSPTEPDVLLLDEPFSNLDAKLRKTMRLQVRKLQQRLQSDHGLRDARPAGGALAVGRGRGHQSRQSRAGRHAGRGLPAAALRIRRRLHRLDQPAAGVVRGYDADSRQAVVTGRGRRDSCVSRTTGRSPRAPGQSAVQAGAAATGCRTVELRGQLSAVAYLGSVIQYQVEVGACSLEVVMPAEAPMARAGRDGRLEASTSRVARAAARWHRGMHAHAG